MGLQTREFSESMIQRASQWVPPTWATRKAGRWAVQARPAGSGGSRRRSAAAPDHRGDVDRALGRGGVQSISRARASTSAAGRSPLCFTIRLLLAHDYPGMLPCSGTSRKQHRARGG